MKLQEILETKAVTQITNEHILLMQQMVNNNQRAEAYLYYGQLMGKDTNGYDQLMMQAQITTYSGVVGGAAVKGNFIAKTNNMDKYYITLDTFSEDIIKGMIETIELNINDGKSGILTANEIQAADQAVWADKKMEKWFPGNYQLSWDPYDTSKTKLSDDAILYTVLATGGYLGKREGEYSDDLYYTISFNNFNLKVDMETGIVKGFFPQTGFYSYANDILGDIWDKSYIERMQKQIFLGADSKSGDSIYDIYYDFENTSIEELNKLAKDIEDELIILTEIHKSFNNAFQEFKDEINYSFNQLKYAKDYSSCTGESLSLDSYIDILNDIIDIGNMFYTKQVGLFKIKIINNHLDVNLLNKDNVINYIYNNANSLDESKQLINDFYQSFYFINESILSWVDLVEVTSQMCEMFPTTHGMPNFESIISNDSFEYNNNINLNENSIEFDDYDNILNIDLSYDISSIDGLEI